MSITATMATTRARKQWRDLVYWPCGAISKDEMYEVPMAKLLRVKASFGNCKTRMWRDRRNNGRVPVWEETSFHRPNCHTRIYLLNAPTVLDFRGSALAARLREMDGMESR